MGYTANADLQDFFDRAPAVRFVDRTTRRVGEHITEEVKKRTPVAAPPPGIGGTEFAGMRGRAPGTLRESWYTSDVEREVSHTPGGEKRSVESRTDDDIAPHVEWPTRPHLIRPSAARLAASVVATQGPRREGDDPRARLRFINAFGRVVYALEVWHPGTQGTHMMRDSLAEVEGTWAQTIGRQELERWTREQTSLVR